MLRRMIGVLVGCALASSAAGVTIALGDADDVESPGVPRAFSASSPSSGRIELSWQRATDNTGISEYRVYDRGQFRFPVPSASRSTGFDVPHGAHWLQMDAVDLAGNVSVRTTPIRVVVDTSPPPAPVDVTVDDSYVSGVTRMFVHFTLPRPDDVATCTLLNALGPTNTGTFVPKPDPADGSRYLVVDWNAPRGDAWFQLWCTDDAGNISVRSKPVYVDVKL